MKSITNSIRQIFNKRDTAQSCIYSTGSQLQIYIVSMTTNYLFNTSFEKWN